MRYTHFARSSLLTLLGIGIAAGHAAADPIIALRSDNQLFLADSQTPATVKALAAITGLQAGEVVVGMDFRPATGSLFLVGNSSRLYTIDLTSGVATAVSATPLSPALSGTEFGVDFNPVVDRLRIVSDTGQNLRVVPDTGVATEDTSLTFDAGDPNAAATPAISAAAYTNNFQGASTTTLLGVDAGLDALVLIGGVSGSPSPNLGVMTTVGSIGVASTGLLGLDISQLSGRQFLSATSPTNSLTDLLELRLGTGLPVHKLGSFGFAARDIAAMPLDATPPVLTVTSPRGSRINRRLSSLTVRGTASDNQLVKSVQYRTITRGRATPFRDATGLANWEFRLRNLRASPSNRTIIRIIATDAFGNRSSQRQIVVG